MSDVRLSSQDWYRVRRGEDQIVWGDSVVDSSLPEFVLSRRASEEMAFLETADRQLLLNDLSSPSASDWEQFGDVVAHGCGRRQRQIGVLRIVARRNEHSDKIEVSTVRGGPVLDPENVGPIPGS